MSKLAHSNDETMAQIEANARADDRDEFTRHGQYCRGGAADCTCSPEYRENLAQIAEALMESTAQNCPGWHPADCPSEIVVDLVNERDELRTALVDLVAVFDAEAQGVAQQVTKPERIASARAVLEAYSR